MHHLRERFPPGFFDLPQSAGGTLPLGIIAAWTSSAQTPEVARALVAPHVLQGIIVASDSAGLTRLGRERPLIEILAMIGQPKEIIHACGRAIGGRPIGVWVADNTEMFYPADIPTARILAMLNTTMQRIARDCELGIGMAVHAGAFFELGDAVHGVDAERVETLAEEYTEGGELVVTADVEGLLPSSHDFALAPRADLHERFGRVLRLTAGATLDDLDAHDVAYPAPYSSEFSTELAEYTRTRRDSRMPRPAYLDLAVVLVECEPDRAEVPEVGVLNNLALTAAMKRIGHSHLVSYDGREVKSVGRLGIYTFADALVAIEFARAFRASFAEQGVQCRIGIDAGPVLVFDLGRDTHDIAGSAVNVASKLAQDVGEYGRIQFSDTVARRAGVKPARVTRTFHVSGVELRAYDV